MSEPTSNIVPVPHEAVDTAASLRRLKIYGFASVASLVGIFTAWSYLADINGAVIANATTPLMKASHSGNGDIVHANVVMTF